MEFYEDGTSKLGFFTEYPGVSSTNYEKILFPNILPYKELNFILSCNNIFTYQVVFMKHF